MNILTFFSTKNKTRVTAVATAVIVALSLSLTACNNNTPATANAGENSTGGGTTDVVAGATTDVVAGATDSGVSADSGTAAASTDGGTSAAASTDGNGGVNTTAASVPVNNAKPTGGNMNNAVIEKGEQYAVITVKDYGSMTFKLFPDIAPVGVRNFIDVANSGYYSGKIIHRVMKDFMIQGGSKNGDGAGAPGEKTFGLETAYNARHFYGALSYANSGQPNSNGVQFYIVNAHKMPAGVPAIEYTQQDVDDTKNEFALVQKYKNGDAEVRKSIKEFPDSDKAMLDQLTEADWAQVYTSYEEAIKLYSDTVAHKSEIEARYAEVGGVPFLDGDYTVFGQITDGTDVLDKLSAVQVKASPGNPGEISLPLTDIVIEKVEIKTKD